MTNPLSALGIRVFTTCPPSHGATADAYLKQVVRTARWSERAGCEGVLIYSDNGTVDPWLVAQTVIDSTSDLAPLVAVNPVYAHPFTVAKLVSSIAFLHGRRVYLNMVAGGFANDLAALNDPTPHDERYARLIEYTHAVMSLLTSTTPVTTAGRYYGLTNLKAAPPMDPALVPQLFVSGSSPAGAAAAQDLAALAVRYPEPAGAYEDEPPGGGGSFGIRVGIVAREETAAAWRAARARFPVDRRGQVTHQLAMKVSDSGWHRQLSGIAEQATNDDEPYWMVPFENYKTFCPYLVGSYDRIAAEIARYIRVGCRTIILDIVPSEKELGHIAVALERAAERALA
jgi:alkanesulfonate monooxygenase